MRIHGERLPGSCRLPAAAGLLLAGALCLAPARAQETTATPRPSGLTERVRVTATRLPASEEPRRNVPAFVTVITREQIERSGARTVQQLLSMQAGVVLYDQTGNGIETTLELRGFSQGTGTSVFLDGARLNDPRNNTVSLELVPIDADGPPVDVLTAGRIEAVYGVRARVLHDPETGPVVVTQGTVR